jgi:alpha-D-xyloside xylohydrolase
VYKRWCAFGLLSSHSRLHGNSSYRVPWLFDEQAVEVLRRFTRLKCRLMPYLFGAAREAHATGVPVMRAMLLEFADDPACDYLDRQYMLGDALLVAPVLSPDGLVDYYVPAGRWTHFLTGEVVEGGRWVRERYDYLSLPLLARPNSVIAVGDHDDLPDYDYADGVTVHAFDLSDGAHISARIPAPSGEAATTIELRREGPDVRIQALGANKPWRILLRGVDTLHSVAGGVAQADSLGTLVIPTESETALSVRLRTD